MKNIVIYAPALGVGGSEKSLMHYLNALAGMANVTLILMKGVNTYQLDNRISVKIIPSRFSNLLSWFPVISCVKKCNAHLVVGWSLYPALILLMTRFLHGRKILISERNSTIHALRLRPSIFSKAELLLIRKYYCKSDFIVFNSLENLRYFRRFLKLPAHRLCFLPNAVEQHFRHHEDPDLQEIDAKLGTSFRVLLVGRLDSQKGFDFYLNAIGEFSSLDIKTIIIGGGSELQPLQTLVDKNSLEEKVFFLGEKKNVADYFQIANVFVLPSRYEGFPNVLLEAMANGIPVLASNCFTGPHELLAEKFSEHLFRVEDAADFKLKFQRLIDDYSNARSAAHFYKDDIVEKYSRHTVYRQYQEMFMHLLGSKETATKPKQYSETA